MKFTITQSDTRQIVHIDPGQPLDIEFDPTDSTPDLLLECYGNTQFAAGMTPSLQILPRDPTQEALTYQVVEGALPDGLRLESDGIVRGFATVPAQNGQRGEFTVAALNSSGEERARGSVGWIWYGYPSLELRDGNGNALAPTLNLQAGQSFSAKLVASGGCPLSYLVWSLGSLMAPVGLSVAADGTLSGTIPADAPTTVGYALPMYVNDGLGTQGKLMLIINISAAAVPDPTPDPTPTPTPDPTPTPSGGFVFLDPARPDLSAPQTPPGQIGKFTSVQTRYGYPCVRSSDDRDYTGDGDYARHIYSRVQAFSPSGTKVLYSVGDSTTSADNGYYHISDLAAQTTSARLPFLAGDNCEAHWMDETHIAHIGQNGALRGVDVIDLTTGKATPLFRLPAQIGSIGAYSYARTGAEGRPSEDNRYWPFLLQDSGYHYIGVCVYDATAKAVVWSSPMHGAATDHCSITHDGRWLLISNSRFDPSDDGDDFRANAGTWVIDVTGVEAPFKIACGSEHSDIGKLADGTPAFIYADFESNSEDQGWVWWAPIDPSSAVVPMSDGLVGSPNAHRIVSCYGTPLGNDTGGFHICGLKPGWALIGHYGSAFNNGSTPRKTWFQQRLFAAELVPGGRIALIGDLWSNNDSGKDYASEPHACWTPDGRHLVFASNLGVTGGGVSDYVLEIPALS